MNSIKIYLLLLHTILFFIKTVIKFVSRRVINLNVVPNASEFELVLSATCMKQISENTSNLKNIIAIQRSQSSEMLHCQFVSTSSLPETKRDQGCRRDSQSRSWRDKLQEGELLHKYYQRHCYANNVL